MLARRDARRTLLASACLLLLVPLAACRSGQAADPGAGKPAESALMSKVGVQLYSFRNQLDADLEGTLAKVAAMGLREVETHSFFGRDAAAFAALLKKHGLNPRSMGTSFDKLTNDVDGVIADARALGADYVTCTWIPHAEEGYTAADNENAITVFSRAGAALKAAGLRLVYHPHGYEFHDGGTGKALLDQMIERVPGGVLDFEMDVFWVVHAGADPLDYLSRYPGRFILFHLKEMKPGTPTGLSNGKSDTENQVVLGQGIIDMPAIIAAGRAQNAAWYFIEDESARVMEQVPQSLRYLAGLR